MNTVTQTAPREDRGNRHQDHAVAAAVLPDGEAARHTDLIELMFFAYRDFTADPDAILANDGFGRAHHRVLHFVGRKPGLTVAELLAILQITKQSLARVLKDLIRSGHITQESGRTDRRQRHLVLTAKGQDLASRLSQAQTLRIDRALAAMDPARRDAVHAFLFAMLDDANRAQFLALPRETAPDAADDAA